MPHERVPALQHFLEHTQSAIVARAGHGTPAAAAIRKVGAALAMPVRQHSPAPPRRLAVCHHLAGALDSLADAPPDLARLAGAVRDLAPSLVWRQRTSTDAAFLAGHANAYVVGPDAESIEQNDSVRIGLSLMAPGVTYPDHQHPPEEVYIVLSGGEWRQGAGSWLAPGQGGIVYNPPNIVHAMRAGSQTLLAIWCLPIDPDQPADRHRAT